MIKVIQIIDTLHAGGAERLAINYANELAHNNVESHLCVTRSEGPLLESLDDNVGYLFLNRRSTLDVRAILCFRSYILKHKINVLHAHSSSFFIASLVKLISPRLNIVWHDHYGNSEFLYKRPVKMLRFCSTLFSQIFSVNVNLRDWARQELSCKQVSYIRNFPILKENKLNLTKLHGEDGKRVICLANLREQKNHLRLLESFKLVAENHPDWTLHCIGKNFDDDYSKQFFKKITDFQLQDHVFFYNSKSDILNILQQGTIGILVSKSEGLPLAMLEYGIAGLPVISTDVGECGSLITNSSYGILLKDDKDKTIVKAIFKFINDESLRRECAKKFNEMILRDFSKEKIIKDVIGIYNKVILN